MSDEITSALLSDDQIQKIRDHIAERLKNTSKRAVSRDDIYNALKKDLASIERSHFKTALSLSVRENRLPEMEMKLGKAGGIGFRTNSSKPATPSTEKPSTSASPVVSSPKPKKVSEIEENEITKVVWDDKIHYYRMPFGKVKNFFTKIFDLNRDREGNLQIGDAIYQVPDEAHDFIQNGLWYLDGEFPAAEEDLDEAEQQVA